MDDFIEFLIRLFVVIMMLVVLTTFVDNLPPVEGKIRPTYSKIFLNTGEGEMSK